RNLGLWPGSPYGVRASDRLHVSPRRGPVRRAGANGGPRPRVERNRMTELCTLGLGLVILPKPGLLEQALEELSHEESLELGAPNGHRIPASAWCEAGADEQLIAHLEGLSAVLKVDVVYAQIIEE